jgi:hypothetical protein
MVTFRGDFSVSAAGSGVRFADGGGAFMYVVGSAEATDAFRSTR